MFRSTYSQSVPLFFISDDELCVYRGNLRSLGMCGDREAGSVFLPPHAGVYVLRPTSALHARRKFAPQKRSMRVSLGVRIMDRKLFCAQCFGVR